MPLGRQGACTLSDQGGGLDPLFAQKGGKWIEFLLGDVQATERVQGRSNASVRVRREWACVCSGTVIKEPLIKFQGLAIARRLESFIFYFQ